MFFHQSSEEAGRNTSALLSAADKARIPKEDYITCRVKEEEEFVQDSLEAELSAGRSLVHTDDKAFKKEEDLASEEAQTSLSGGSEGNISFPPKQAADKARIPKEDYITCRVKEEEEFVQDSLEAELSAGRSLVHTEEKEEDLASEEAQTSLTAGSEGNISFPPKRERSQRGLLWREEEVQIMLTAIKERNFATLLMGSTPQPNRRAYVSISQALDKRGFRRTPTQAQNKWKILKKAFFDARAACDGEPRPAGRPPHYLAILELWKMAGKPHPTDRRAERTSSPRRVQEPEEEEKREGGSDVDEGPSGEPASATVAEGSDVGGGGVPPGGVSLQMVIDRVSELERRMTRMEQLAERTARDVRLLMGTLAAQGTAKGAPAS